MLITVLVVDDHALVRRGVSSLIRSEAGLTVSGEGATLAEGRSQLASSPPDVLLVDVSLPDGNGLELAGEARVLHPLMGIVVLTMHSDDRTLLGALRVGASALVLKSAPSEELVDAIRRAADMPDSFNAKGLAVAMRRQHELAVAHPAMTRREAEVLQHLVAGLSVAQVADALGMSESTVKTHITKVYEKLGVHNRAAAVMGAVRLGLVRDARPVA